MIPMLLVVGCLVPTSDSHGSVGAGESRSAGAFVDVRVQIRVGMSIDEVRHLLAEPGPLPEGGPGFEIWKCRRLRLEVAVTYGKVTRVTRFATEDEIREAWNLPPRRK
jgi:hypothetical protein